ncbi:hypothetical protein ACLMAL_15095 [Nocardia sp. CWNU-33]|uniref:hypothetical protein n=1 Tax=unclassified Nocardia TaxID=2637762 RepID=UPI00366B57EC
MTIAAPGEPDVHLQIDLHGVVLHYAAHPSAARRLMADESIHHYIDNVSVIPGTAAELPRLPCEQLYLGP